MMFQNFYPNKLIRSVYELNWEELSRTYGGVIFDIDNTLVPHGAPADEKIIKLFEKIHALGMKTMLVSNNGEARVKPFAQQVQTDYIYKAGKPKVEGYNKAMAKMGTDPKHTLFIGDQIFTDVWSAKRLGLRAYLVKPIKDKLTPLFRFKRALEVPVLKRYAKKHGGKS
mgnify:CR=1 FL=1